MKRVLDEKDNFVFIYTIKEIIIQKMHATKLTATLNIETMASLYSKMIRVQCIGTARSTWVRNPIDEFNPR